MRSLLPRHPPVPQIVFTNWVAIPRENLPTPYSTAESVNSFAAVVLCWEHMDADHVFIRCGTDVTYAIG